MQLLLILILIIIKLIELIKLILIWFRRKEEEVAKGLTKDSDLDKWVDDCTRYLVTASQLLLHPLFLHW